MPTVPPAVPSIGDINRYNQYLPVSPTTVFAVGFAVFGDGNDIEVWWDGVRIFNWAFSSLSGDALSTIPLPITDGIVTVDTAISSGVVEIFGLWRPRQGILDTSPSINRREYQQDLGQVVASLRELWENLVSTFPLSAYGRENKYLAFDGSGQPFATAGLTPNTVTVSSAMEPVIGAATLANALTLLGFSSYFQGLIGSSNLAGLLTAFAFSADIQTFLAAPNKAYARFDLGATTVGDELFTSFNAAGAMDVLGLSAFFQTLVSSANAPALLTLEGWSSYVQTLKGVANGGQLLNLVGYGTTRRQCAVYGPAALLPATAVALSIASQNVSSSVPLVVSSALGWLTGGANDRMGVSTSDLTWGSLAASQTNYLYVNVAVDGTLTTGSTILAPAFLPNGGSASATNNQFTFDVFSMKMFQGNGSVATAVNTVFIGEAVTGVSTVTSTVLYAYRGEHLSTLVAVPGVSAQATFAHKLGVPPSCYSVDLRLVCVTTNASYAVGAELEASSGLGIGTLAAIDIHNAAFSTLNAVSISAAPYGGGAAATLTNADWNLRLTAQRTF